MAPDVVLYAPTWQEASYTDAVDDLADVGARMQAIAQWVDRYQQRIPQLIEQEFPGKREIMLRIAQEVKQIEDEIAALNRQKAA